MLELAQHIQVFLHKHDRPPVSLHEEMVERQRAEERREREEKRDSCPGSDRGACNCPTAIKVWTKDFHHNNKIIIITIKEVLHCRTWLVWRNLDF